MLPLLQSPKPNSAIVESSNPRSLRYGCVASRFFNSKPSGLFGSASEADSFLATTLELSRTCEMFGSPFPWDGSPGETLNHSQIFNAASRIVIPSFSATKSRMLPPRLQLPKQFQQFLLRLTRNCVGLLPS